MTPPLVVAAAGDFAPTGRLAEAIAAGEGPRLLAATAPVFAGATIACVNLEAALGGTPPRAAQGSIALIAPAQSAALLADVNVRVVNLANNHAMDGGAEGLAATMRHLRDAGIRWFGAGETLEAALAPLIVETHAGPVAFIGRCVPGWWNARRATPGVAPFTSIDECIFAVREARRLGARYVLLHHHGGEELFDVPWPERVALLRRLAWETDADVTFGNHAHIHHGDPGEPDAPNRLVISQGNLLMDIPYHQRVEPSRWSVVVRVSLMDEPPSRLETVWFRKGELALEPATARELERLRDYERRMAELLADDGRHRLAWDAECHAFRRGGQGSFFPRWAEMVPRDRSAGAQLGRLLASRRPWEMVQSRLRRWREMAFHEHERAILQGAWRHRFRRLTGQNPES